MPRLVLQDYMENFKNCLQYEKPYCQAECPFHLDVKEYIEKLKQGNFNSAYKIYRNAVGFPAIVSHICSEPCKNVCPVKDYGGPIEMRMLEEASIKYAKRTDPTSYNIPVRPGKVAIIGSGLAGLGTLLRMATKKYETHIFEKSDSLGGKLNDDPNSKIFMADIEKQLHHEKYEVHLNTEIKSREEINNMDFDVVFVATGDNGNDFGLLNASNDLGHKYVLIDESHSDEKDSDKKTAWFGGGALIGDEGVFALAGGLYMGLVLEAYIKTGNLNYPDDEKTTNTIVDTRKITEKNSTRPENQIYSEEEVAEEVGRCLQCQCDFCKTYEDLAGYYDKFPLRIKDEVFATTLEGSSEVKATPAKRLIHTSNLTGITKAVCPKDIDLDNLILAGRQRMHNQEKAPWAFHDFWLRDMEFANSNEAGLCLPAKANEMDSDEPMEKKCDFAFFPGCQLGASLPELVNNTYELLLGNDEQMGLLLRCCGAPAEWSGDDDTHENALSEFESQWKDMGSPTLLTACPTCTAQIKKHLPQMKVMALYEYLDENCNIASPNNSNMEFSVFDPCSTREDYEVKESVRNIVHKLGIENGELPDQSYIPRCCSFGGQPQIANPQYIDYVVDKRTGESELPYITYCINCRDAFLKAGKNVRHILELLPNVDKGTNSNIKTSSTHNAKGNANDTNEKNNELILTKLPTVSERRDNRIYLKKMLLEKHGGKTSYENWSAEMEENKKTYDFELVLSDEILEVMDKERILKEEVYEVCDYMIRTGRSVIDPDTGIHSGYKQIGYMTYWVSYLEDSKESNGMKTYEIIDVYTHRMEIELEAVWNGVKQETDM